MKDHRPKYVLRITPLKLMDLLWSLISDLSSANLVSGGKNLSRDEIHSVVCNTFYMEIKFPLFGFCRAWSPCCSQALLGMQPTAQIQLCCSEAKSVSQLC